MRELDLPLPDGRNVHVYDGGPAGGASGPTVFWHHGTPQTGQLPPPLLERSEQLGIRLVSHDRPGYGSSSADSGRPVATTAQDVAAIADAVGVGRFAVLGASGGGPHALACAAVLGDRVRAVACLASIAPYDAPDLDWYEGMAPSGVAEFRAAARSRSALVRHLSRPAPDDFNELAPADVGAFVGPYGDWLVQSSTAGLARGYEGAVEDDQGFVHPWGCDPTTITAPVLLMHGEADRLVPVQHSRWLAGRCPSAELRSYPDDGHISIFAHGFEALDWIVDRLAADR